MATLLDDEARGRIWRAADEFLDSALERIETARSLPFEMDLDALRAAARARAPAVAARLVDEARAAALDAMGDTEGATAIAARRLCQPEVPPSATASPTTPQDTLFTSTR
jgi:hypothetical protein